MLIDDVEKVLKIAWKYYNGLCYEDAKKLCEKMISEKDRFSEEK